MRPQLQSLRKLAYSLQGVGTGARKSTGNSERGQEEPGEPMWGAWDEVRTLQD